MPRISVIMPMRNGHPYVEEAIESIRAQSFTDWELLVVDDASTDGSPDWVRNLADPRIRVMANHGSGAGQGRNTGIEAASGEYIVMMDADDISPPHRLETLIVYMDAHPDIALAGSYSEKFGAQTGINRRYTSNLLITATLLFRSHFIGATIIFRKNLVTERYPAMPYGEDSSFCQHVALRLTVANIPEALYRQRVHHASQSFTVPRTPYLRQMWAECAPRRLGFIPTPRQIDAIMDWNGQAEVKDWKNRCRFALHALCCGTYPGRERAVLAGFLLYKMTAELYQNTRRFHRRRRA